MKVLGIEISGREVRIVALKKEGSEIVDYTEKYKPIVLEDDEFSENVLLFRNTLFAAFHSFAPNTIVIKYRNPNGKGQQAPSPISFKIEGLIQTYNNVEIKFTKPQTTAAYFKKNPITIKPNYSYQTEALKVAYHFLKTN